MPHSVVEALILDVHQCLTVLSLVYMNSSSSS